jgi:uncharacterized protein YdbL (DUF1318 family)
MARTASLAASLFLSACVTVNIYFPAAAVQRAADRIVEETWGEPGKEAPRPGPKGALPSRRSFALALSAREAHAQEADVNVSNPAIRALREAIRARSDAIKPYLDKGNVGIDHNGHLVIRATDGLSLKERAEAQRLVEAENRDREALYAEIARANNFPRERVADIRKIFAKSWMDNARPGWWIEDGPGHWRRKERLAVARDAEPASGSRVLRQPAIHRERPGAFDDQREADPHDQDVKLEALTGLSSRPVHEKAVLEVRGGHGDHHVRGDPDRGDARQKPEQDRDRSKELRDDGEESEKRRDTHVHREKMHGSFEARPPEPAQHLLRAVGKHHHGDGDPHEGQSHLVGRAKKHEEHRALLLIFRRSASAPAMAQKALQVQPPPLPKRSQS